MRASRIAWSCSCPLRPQTHAEFHTRYYLPRPNLPARRQRNGRERAAGDECFNPLRWILLEQRSTGHTGRWHRRHTIEAWNISLVPAEPHRSFPGSQTAPPRRTRLSNHHQAQTFIAKAASSFCRRALLCLPVLRRLGRSLLLLLVDATAVRRG